MVRKSYIQQMLGPAPREQELFKPPPEPEKDFEVSFNTKFEHAWILAAPGSGKTTLIYREILQHLSLPDPPAMVVIDPKGTMIEDIAHLQMFDPIDGEHKDRLLIIDLTDYANLPALNPFHHAGGRFHKYSDGEQQQIINKTIENLTFAFNSRAANLSPQMTTCFNQACRLLFTLRATPTLDTLVEIVGEKTDSWEKSRWKDDIERLPERARKLFETKFYKDWKTTRESVVTRIHGITEDPLMGAIFCSATCKVDMFRLLQDRKLVIVNCPLGLLLDTTVETLARFFITLTLNAAFERLMIPKSQWTPAFLFIDEFQEVADEEKVPQLLRLARQFKLGCYLANQDIEILPPKLRSALSSATITKYVSGLGGFDLNFMAREMRTSPESLGEVVPDKAARVGHFACHVKGQTRKPVDLRFPFGEIEKLPRMSDERYRMLIERSREAFSEKQKPVHTPSTQRTYTPIDPSEDY